MDCAGRSEAGDEIQQGLRVLLRGRVQELIERLGNPHVLAPGYVRQHGRPARIEILSKRWPVTLMVFDLLYLPHRVVA